MVADHFVDSLPGLVVRLQQHFPLIVLIQLIVVQVFM